MNNKPKFSIIIPAYNAEKTVRKSIQSIQSQTYSDFEIIIVNDGSTDSTLNIIMELSASDQRIRYLDTLNGGPGEARNKGLKQATGDYIVFIDVDDFIKEDFLSVYVDTLSEANLDLVISSFKTEVYDGEEVVSEQYTSYPDTRLNMKEEFLSEMYNLTNNQLLYVVWNKVYRRDIIIDNNITFPNYRSCEDRIFNVRYYQYVDKAIVLNKANFIYSFDGKNSLTNKFFENKFDTFIHWYKELLNIVNKDYNGYASLFLKGVMSCLVSLHSESCTLNFKEKLEYCDNILNNKMVTEAAKISSTETVMKKSIKFLFKTKSVYINYSASKVMYLISQMSPKTIEKFKTLY